MFLAYSSLCLILLVNLQEIRKGLTELKDGLKQIREELTEHFSDASPDDKYAMKMINFVKHANVQCCIGESS